MTDKTLNALEDALDEVCGLAGIAVATKTTLAIVKKERRLGNDTSKMEEMLEHDIRRLLACYHDMKSEMNALEEETCEHTAPTVRLG